jgi:hypothetical protein
MGFRVLIVAHSQGNFFANNILEDHYSGPKTLHWDFEKKSARLVSVATPSSHVEDGEYTTLQSDGVIRTIPRALPPNSQNTQPSPGRFDHEFVKHYLKGNGAWPQIERQIYQQAQILGQVGHEGSHNEALCFKGFTRFKNKSYMRADGSQISYINSDNFHACVETCEYATIMMVAMHAPICPAYCTRFCRCRLGLVPTREDFETGTAEDL